MSQLTEDQCEHTTGWVLCGALWIGDWHTYPLVTYWNAVDEAWESANYTGSGNFMWKNITALYSKVGPQDNVGTLRAAKQWLQEYLIVTQEQGKVQKAEPKAPAQEQPPASALEALGLQAVIAPEERRVTRSRSKHRGESKEATGATRSLSPAHTPSDVPLEGDEPPSRQPGQLATTAVSPPPKRLSNRTTLARQQPPGHVAAEVFTNTVKQLTEAVEEMAVMHPLPVMLRGVVALT